MTTLGMLSWRDEETTDKRDEGLLLGKAEGFAEFLGLESECSGDSGAVENEELGTNSKVGDLIVLCRRESSELSSEARFFE